MKTLLVLPMICLLSSPLAAQEIQTIEKKLSLPVASEQVVTITLNDRLIIEMISNPSTGYRWDSNQRTRERRCYILSELAMENSQSEALVPVVVGAPTAQQWSLKLDPNFPCTSAQVLSWTYHRPWEPSSPQDQRATLTLQAARP